jgi:hypothetical protein
MQVLSVQKILTSNGISPHCMEKNSTNMKGESRVALVNDSKKKLKQQTGICTKVAKVKHVV